MANYRINENFMADLEKKLARIQKKCEKHGCAFTFTEIGEEFETVKDEETGKEITTRFVLVNVEGKAIINDWEFCASIDKTENGNIIDKALGDIEVPHKYWTSSLYCEHCNHHRARKHAYLVRNTETGEFKQVGRACLAEYTHGLSAEAVASMLELKNACEEAEERWDGCSHSGWMKWYKSEDVLALAFGAVRAFGYVKSDMPNSTRMKVYEYIKCINRDYPRSARRYYWAIEDEMALHQISYTKEQDLADARKALDWLKMQDESTDYMHNMKTAIGTQTEEGRLGLLISLVPTYCRAIEREIERKEREEQQKKEAKDSEYVGQLGERFSFVIDSFRIVTSWATDFGLVVLYKFTDKNGNVILWKTSKDLDERVIGKTMIGTVKDHKEFREVKQTELTRCKIS